jgi:hypothetical protein
LYHLFIHVGCYSLLSRAKIHLWASNKGKMSTTIVEKNIPKNSMEMNPASTMLALETCIGGTLTVSLKYGVYYVRL